MKRLFAIILVCLLVFSLGACKPEDTNPTEPASTQGEGSYEIDWSSIPDSEIIGAWEPEESVNGEYVLFTDDGKLRVVYGTVAFDSVMTYGVDGYGNKSGFTEGNYLYGQWTYKVEGDKLTINYPEEEAKVFNSINYTPITLEAMSEFNKDEALVGKWLNNAYGDSYEFTADGYAIFRQKVDDGIYVYETEIKHTYTVEDGNITMSFFKNNGGAETEDTIEYSIEGTKLLIGDSDYYLNGEGSPEAVDVTTAE